MYVVRDISSETDIDALSPVKDISTYRAATVNVPRWVYPARSAPGARPKRRLNARLKELSDW